MRLLRTRVGKFFTGILLSAALTASGHAQPRAPQIARQVDTLLAAELSESAAELASRTSDTTYLRRVWLDITGDLPTPEELIAFRLDPHPDKRANLVRELLDRPAYGQNWARYWRDVILYRRLEDRAMLVSNPLVADLTGWLNANRSWDAIAAEFISAQGDVRENGATAIIAAQEGRTEETTAEMSRIFLGIQIQCAQCHDHPYDRWKREQFHELAAFFPRVGYRQVQTPTRRSYEVVANDRPQRTARQKSANDNRRGTAEHFMPDLDDPSAPGTRMEPRFFLTDAQLQPSSRDAQRRGTVADWITHSEWFATALVNRIWAELVGEGFYEPIDDLGPDRTPANPQVIRLLAQSFTDSGYDLKWLFRTICATEAYNRECRPRRSPSDPPFTANVAQRLRGDQLFNALLTALDVDEPEVARSGLGGTPVKGYDRRGVAPRMMFTVFFGYDPSDPRDSVVRSIPQALAMMNTERIHRLARGGTSQTMLGKLLRNYQDDQVVTLELYLRCLSREPSDDELDQALTYVADSDDRTEAFEDLLWALLNSAEFTHRR